MADEKITTIDLDSDEITGGYDNVVLETQMTDITNTLLDVNSLMTIDTSLTQSAGMKKTIHKYTYTGTVEKLAKGAKNSSKGKVNFESTDYEVNRYQQTFEYNDNDIMKDPKLLDSALEGAGTTMVNHIKTEYFEELEKITNEYSYASTGFNYDAVVDGLAMLDTELENGMFLVMGNDLKAIIRKNDEFKSSKQGEILYSGQFGTISGIPVVFSKLVPKNTAYITEKTAIKFFVKNAGSIEQDRDIETKDNTVVYDRYGVMALVDETKSVKFVKTSTSSSSNSSSEE